MSNDHARFKGFVSDTELLSLVLDLVSAVQSQRHALLAVSKVVSLSREHKMLVESALATSEKGTDNILKEVRKLLERNRSE